MNKNIICIVLVLALSLSVISCGGAVSETIKPAEDVVILPTELPTEPADTPEDVDSGMTIDTEEEFKGAFTALLSEIQLDYLPRAEDYYVTGAAFAAKLADMLSIYAPDIETVKAVTESFAEGLEVDKAATLAEKISGIQNSFIGIMGGNMDVLRTAGYTPVNYPWNEDTVRSYLEEMFSALDKASYAPILDKYYTALSQGWSHERFIEEGLNYIALDSGGEKPLEKTGYTLADLDGCGSKELIIGTISQDEFYGAMVLELHNMGGYGVPEKIFSSTERNRYYSMGANLFRHVGSSGADDSFDRTEQYYGGLMTDMGYSSGEIKQLELTPFSRYGEQ